MPPDKVDYLPHDSDLEEVSSNARRHGEQVNELLFTEIDARYDQTDGVLEKDFSDWQIAVDTDPHHHSSEWLAGTGDSMFRDGDSVNKGPSAEEITVVSPTSIPTQRLEQ